MSFIVKIILSVLALSSSAPAVDETIVCPFNVLFYSPITNCISSDLQKLLKYFNGTEVVAFLRTPFVSTALLFPNRLTLYSKN